MIRKIFFMLILNFLSYQLFSEVKILKCQQLDRNFPGEILRIKESKTAEKLTREAKEAIDSAKRCLPPKMRQDVTDFLISTTYNIQLVCDSFINCGEAWDPYWEKDLNFSAAAIPIDYSTSEKDGSCGCIQATLFHELIHLATHVGDEGHKEIYGCEQKCLKTIANCIKYPPPFGKECNCADFKKK